jgi:hypothetical protein
MDHMEVDIQGEGENQRVRVWGNATLFPRIHALLPRIGFMKREDEQDRSALILNFTLICFSRALILNFT